MQQNMLLVHNGIFISWNDECKLIVSSGKIVLVLIATFAEIELKTILCQRSFSNKLISLCVHIDQQMTVFKHGLQVLHDHQVMLWIQTSVVLQCFVMIVNI